jgi:hypothetical protein
MELQFEEIPISILIASCVMPCTSARIFIKIYLRCQDETLWKILSDTILFSNNTDRYLIFHRPKLYEITPFL